MPGFARQDAGAPLDCFQHLAHLDGLAAQLADQGDRAETGECRAAEQGSHGCTVTRKQQQQH